MKRILKENMIRFGTKNLKEQDDDEATNKNFFKKLKSIPKATKLSFKIKNMIDKGKEYDYILAVLLQEIPNSTEEQIKKILDPFWEQNKPDTSSEDNISNQLDNLLPQDDEITGTDIGDTKTIKNTAVLSIENNRCVFVVSVGANDNTVRLIPDGATLDYLANVSPGKIQDVLHKFCEQSTGIKFSPVYNDSGAGYAFEIDMYSVADKIKRN